MGYFYSKEIKKASAIYLELNFYARNIKLKFIEIYRKTSFSILKEGSWKSICYLTT